MTAVVFLPLDPLPLGNIVVLHECLLVGPSYVKQYNDVLVELYLACAYSFDIRVRCYIQQ